jgi:hypothetical protein
MSADAKHTAEPWRAECWLSHSASTVLVDDPTALTGKRVIADCSNEEDARRIVACVNACKGVKTETLENVPDRSIGFFAYSDLREQRDELAEALREMGDWLAYGLDKPDGAEPTAADYKRAEEVAAKGRAALAKVTA